jgi:hypothetical protein
MLSPTVATQSHVAAEAEDPLRELRAKLIAHPVLLQVEKQLTAAIEEPAGGNIVAVFGPSGVGKTVLMNAMIRRLLARETEAMERNPGYTPIAWMEAAAPTSGNFNWRDNFVRCLEALGEPLIDRKRIYGPATLPGSAPVPLRHSAARVDDLQHAVEVSIRNRGTGTILIDEAQNLLKMRAGLRRLDQMDVVKSLSNLSGALYVLFGTYELTELLHLSPQLFRRTVPIHLRRYRRMEPAERVGFAQVLREFQTCAPLRGGPPLLEDYDYFYEHSLGCVGILKCWLVRAARAALDDGEEHPSMRHFEGSKLSTQGLAEMARDISAAEMAQVALGFEREHIIEFLDGVPPEQHSKLSRPKKRKMPGHRGPVRDPAFCVEGND